MKPNNEKAVTYTIWIGIILILLFGWSIYRESKADTPELASTKVQQNDETLIKKVLDSAPRTGSLNPTVIIAEFGDFECPYCKEAAPIISSVVDKYSKDTQRVWIHTPNPKHANAESAAIASQCAHQQNQFWKYHDLLFQNQDQLSTSIYNQIAASLNMNTEQFQSCLTNPATKELVQSHYTFAKQSGVDATPYINVNEQTISGLFTAKELEEAVLSNL